jgi:hypothetical protein
VKGNVPKKGSFFFTRQTMLENHLADTTEQPPILGNDDILLRWIVNDKHFDRAQGVVHVAAFQEGSTGGLPNGMSHYLQRWMYSVDVARQHFEQNSTRQVQGYFTLTIGEYNNDKCQWVTQACPERNTQPPDTYNNAHCEVTPHGTSADRARARKELVRMVNNNGRLVII